MTQTTPFKFVPGINLLLVTTELANLPDEQLDLHRDALRGHVQYLHFGEQHHHSHVPDLWRRTIKALRDHAEPVLVCTESPYVVDCWPEGPEELTRRIVRVTAEGPRHLTAIQAAEVIAAYAYDNRLIGGILRSLELW